MRGIQSKWSTRARARTETKRASEPHSLVVTDQVIFQSSIGIVPSVVTKVVGLVLMHVELLAFGCKLTGVFTGRASEVLNLMCPVVTASIVELESFRHFLRKSPQRKNGSQRYRILDRLAPTLSLMRQAECRQKDPLIALFIFPTSRECNLQWVGCIAQYG